MEVTHKALLWAWGRLRTWIEQDLDSLLVRQQLDAAVQEWGSHGRDSTYLYRGLRSNNVEEAVKAVRC